MNYLEKYLCSMHNRKYCLLTGNGTTSIYLAIKALNLKNKKIAIPNNTCMNVVLPIYFTGNQPVFLDIDRDSLDINYTELRKKKFDAIIAVHLYGNPCKIKKIEKLCKERNIYLIEDNALAQGIKINKNPTGSFGDISILSFGAGKTIDIGHGGAVMTNNKKLFFKMKLLCKELKSYSKENQFEISNLGLEYKRIYNINYGNNLNNYQQKFKRLAVSKKKYLLYKYSREYDNKLFLKLSKIKDLVKNRQINALYLFKILKEKDIKYLDFPIIYKNSTFWRFNILINKKRNDLLSYLLEKKYFVSSWYPSLDLLFEQRMTNRDTNSDKIAKKILNIWTNEQINKNYLDSIANEIESFFKKEKNE